MHTLHKSRSELLARLFAWAALIAVLTLTIVPAALAELKPPQVCVDDVCSDIEPVQPINEDPTVSLAASERFIKWNPGHYGRASTLRGLRTIRKYWAAHPFCADPRGDKFIKGLAIRFMWREIEVAEGVYDFSKIDEYLDVLQNHCGDTPRRLIIGIDHQANNAHASRPANQGGKMCAPQYIWDRGGVVNWTRKSGRGRCLGRIWIPWVKERYKALLVAIAKRYNDHPMVEMLSSKGEGALGLGGAEPSFDRATYRAAHIDIANAARAAAPNTSVVLGTNFHGNHYSKMQQYVDYTYATPGIGWTWPDTFHRPNQGWPMIHTQYYLKPASGVIGPLAAEHQLPISRGRGTTGYDSAWRHCCDKRSLERAYSKELSRTVDETYAATHSIWMRRDQSSVYNSENLLRVLAANNGGVYSEACPSKWTDHGFSCRTGGQL